MFEALPEELCSLNNILKAASTSFVIQYSQKQGNIELGTATDVVTNVLIYDTNSFVQPEGFLYKNKLAIKEQNNYKIAQQESVITEDVQFNPKTFAFVKSTLNSPSGSLTGKTLKINSITITFSTESTFLDVYNTIISANIPNVGCYLDSGKLVIYSSKFNTTSTEFQNLVISGTSLSNIGLTAGTYTNASCTIYIRGKAYKVADYYIGINNYVSYIVVEKV